MNLRLKIYIVFLVTLSVSVISYYLIYGYFTHSNFYISKHHFNRVSSLPEASILLLANKGSQKGFKNKEFIMIKDWLSIYTKEINFNKINQTYTFRFLNTEDIKISKIVKKLNSFLYLKEINYNLNKSEISLTFGKLAI